MPADDYERWRVFLAIEIPTAVREALTEPLNALQMLREPLRANPIDRIHLTLHFLGHLLRPMVEQIPTALAPVVSRHHRFAVTAQGVGAFPAIGPPHVLWAGIVGADLPKLKALQAELGDALRIADVSVEAGLFHPHLTLGRVTRPPRAPVRIALRDWSARWAEASFGDVPVNQVRLIRSQLGAGPPRYTTLATFDLQ